MIERLEQLTMAQFIDLACGDVSVLTGSRSCPEKAYITMRDICLEYKEIADKAGAQSYILHAGELVKAKIEAAIFSMCGNIIELGRPDLAHEILAEYGISTMSMSDSRVEAEIKSRLARARRYIANAEDDRGRDKMDTEDIRRLFDEQTAAMMAHFKFQIDISSIKATVYAYLVARFHNEIKAQIAALKK